MIKNNLITQTIIPATINETWEFFSDPRNLARITPPEMKFRIRGELDSEEIFEGMKIEYTVRPLLGIPLRWETLISAVEPLHYFVDQQIKGPYALWDHTHIFEEHDEGVLMTDRVEYALPGGRFGHWLVAGLVRKRLKRIFAFRESQISRIFQNSRNYALAV